MFTGCYPFFGLQIVLGVGLASLVRGKDECNHFDLQPRPQVDFGDIEMQRHDTTFKAYIESLYEQLDEAEKDLPRDAAAGMVY